MVAGNSRFRRGDDFGVQLLRGLSGRFQFASRLSLGQALGLFDSAGDQRLDHGGIGESAGVAETIHVALGDFAEDAAHDFAAARLGHSGGESVSYTHLTQTTKRIV